jgi:MFS family permease
MEGNCEKSVNNDGPEVKLKGRALLIYDLKQRRLIPTKILFFVVLSSKFLDYFFFIILCYVTPFFSFPKGIGVLLPYMTIHMKSLGISVEETAIIYGVFPLFSIFAPYAMGIIADKLGNFKVTKQLQ